jgi:hypothetical protein
MCNVVLEFIICINSFYSKSLNAVYDLTISLINLSPPIYLKYLPLNTIWS